MYIILAGYIQAPDCTRDGLKACMVIWLVSGDGISAWSQMGRCCGGGLVTGAAVPLPLGQIIFSKQELQSPCVELVARGAAKQEAL